MCVCVCVRVRVRVCHCVWWGAVRMGRVWGWRGRASQAAGLKAGRVPVGDCACVSVSECTAVCVRSRAHDVRRPAMWARLNLTL